MEGSWQYMARYFVCEDKEDTGHILFGARGDSVSLETPWATLPGQEWKVTCPVGISC